VRTGDVALIRTGEGGLMVRSSFISSEEQILPTDEIMRGDGLIRFRTRCCLNPCRARDCLADKKIEESG
jgi:hypothetical protein